MVHIEENANSFGGIALQPPLQSILTYKLVRKVRLQLKRKSQDRRKQAKEVIKNKIKEQEEKHLKNNLKTKI